jgi:hypothetical protein
MLHSIEHIHATVLQDFALKEFQVDLSLHLMEQRYASAE